MIAYPARVLLRLAALILVLGSWYPMPSRAADAPAAPPTVTVTVSQPIQRELVEWDEYTGQFAAKEYVEIRARVSGYLTDIHFEDARQAEEEGKNRFDAAVQAARTRLRPIPDDVLRLHLRRRAIGDRYRRRRRNAPVARHRRLFRHARRHRVRPHLHSGVLRRTCAGCSASAGSRRASVLRSQLKAPSSFYGASLSLEGLHHDSVPRLLPCFFCLLMGGRSASSTGEAMRPDPTSSGTDRFRRESIVETA